MTKFLLLLTLSTASPAMADAPGWQHRRNLLQEPLPENLDARQEIDGKAFRVSYETDAPDGKPPLSKMHVWTITIEPKQGTASSLRLAVEGDMPQHLHGLPTNIEVLHIDANHFVLKGMKFHMVGWWRLKFNVSDGVRTEDFVFQFIL